MIIRPFGLEDVQYVAEQQLLLNKYHQQFDEGFYAPAGTALEEFSQYVSKRVADSQFALLIAEDGTQQLGYVMGWIEIRPPIYRHYKVGYVSNIFVAEKQRHSGIGRCLYMAIEERFIAHNVDFIEIRSDARNAKTISAFKKYGFEELSLALYKSPRKAAMPRQP